MKPIISLLLTFGPLNTHTIKNNLHLTIVCSISRVTSVIKLSSGWVKYVALIHHHFLIDAQLPLQHHFSEVDDSPAKLRVGLQMVLEKATYYAFSLLKWQTISWYKTMQHQSASWFSMPFWRIHSNNDHLKTYS